MTVFIYIIQFLWPLSVKNVNGLLLLPPYFECRVDMTLVLVVLVAWGWWILCVDVIWPDSHPRKTHWHHLSGVIHKGHGSNSGTCARIVMLILKFLFVQEFCVIKYGVLYVMIYESKYCNVLDLSVNTG